MNSNIFKTIAFGCLYWFPHFVWGTLFWYHFLLFEDGKVENGIRQDSIWYAEQVGRLDIISLLLAGFGIVLAIMAFNWFSYVKKSAEQEARLTARDVTESIAKGYIKDYLDKNPDVIFRALQETERLNEEIKKIEETNEVNDDIADNIAKSFEGEEDV